MNRPAERITEETSTSIPQDDGTNKKISIYARKPTSFSSSSSSSEAAAKPHFWNKTTSTTTTRWRGDHHVQARDFKGRMNESVDNCRNWIGKEKEEEDDDENLQKKMPASPTMRSPTSIRNMMDRPERESSSIYPSWNPTEVDYWSSELPEDQPYSSVKKENGERQPWRNRRRGDGSYNNNDVVSRNQYRLRETSSSSNDDNNNHNNNNNNATLRPQQYQRSSRKYNHHHGNHEKRRNMHPYSRSSLHHHHHHDINDDDKNNNVLGNSSDELYIFLDKGKVEKQQQELHQSFTFQDQHRQASWVSSLGDSIDSDTDILSYQGSSNKSPTPTPTPPCPPPPSSSSITSTTKNTTTTTTTTTNKPVRGSIPRRPTKSKSADASIDVERTPEPTTTTDVSVEIAPGTLVPLRGARETMLAIQKDHITQTSCVCCTVEVRCIADAAYVICPMCRVVNQVPFGNWGVGLGF